MSADTNLNHSRRSASPADALAVDFADQRSRQRIGTGRSLPVIGGENSREQIWPGGTSQSVFAGALMMDTCLEFVASTADFSNGMPPALIVQALSPRSIGFPRFGVRPACRTIFLTLLRRLNMLRFGAGFEDRDGRS